VKIRGATALVTGGAGFIGSHLVEALLAGGAAEVRVVDDLSSGAEDNLAAVRDDPRLRLHHAGLRRPAALDAVSGCDLVVHLAAVKHNPSRDDPAEILSTNVDATFHLFRRAVAAGVGKIVFASSLYVYGTDRPGPFAEDHPLLARTLYGASKISGEYLLRAATAGRATRATTLRYFFVYGPRLYQKNYASSLVPRSLSRILDGRPPEIFGDGSQVFDYIYIDDAVAVTLAAIEHPGDELTVNVASGRGETVLGVVETLLRLTGSDLQPVFASPDETRGTVRTGDPERMLTELGVRPRVPLEEGLRRSIAWWRGKTRDRGSRT